MRKHYLRAFVAILSIAIVSGPWHILHAQQSRDDLGLQGCTIREAAVSGDGSLVLSACRGPTGLYLSRDFGVSWSFASGGVYSAGQGNGVAITNNGLYALVDGVSSGASVVALLRATPPLAGAPLSWSTQLTWSEQASANSTQINKVVGLLSSGDFVLIPLRSYNASTQESPAIGVFNTASNSLVATSILPQEVKTLLSIEVSAGHLFAVIRDTANDSTGRKLYRASFNATTGSIGSWSDITSTLTANGSGSMPDTMHAGPSGALFARLAFPGGQYQIWRSADNGDSYTLAYPSPGSRYYAPRSTEELVKGCSQGSTIIINNLISKDDGASWNSLFASASATFNLFDNDLCLFDPTDTSGNRVLAKFAQGFRISTNVQSGSPSFADATSGMDGIVAYGMSQSKDNPDIVGLITNAGLAFTRNFRSGQRSWAFPLCNGAKSCWANEAQRSAIGVDQTDPSIVYSGTEDVEKGVISVNGDGTFSIAWSTLMESPSDNGWDELRVTTSPFLPGKVVAMYRRVFDNPATSGIDERLGGLYIIDNSTSAVVSALVNEPVRDFIALSETLMFAIVVTDANGGPDGIYRSTDGGGTWSKLSGGDLSLASGTDHFEYDVTRDTLYVAISPLWTEVSLLKLAKASTGDGTWVKALSSSNKTPLSRINAFTLDRNVGDLFVSSGRNVYRSSDQGATWDKYFEGLVSETFYDLRIAPSGLQSTSRVRATSAAKLVGASSIGLSQLTGTKTSTDVTLCQLAVDKNCRSQLSKRRTCSLKVTATDKKTKKRLAGLSVSLERRVGSSGSWKVAKRAKIAKTSGVDIPLVVTQTIQLRAKVKNSQRECTTSTASIRFKSSRPR